jgi:hypothetical protein
MSANQTVTATFAAAVAAGPQPGSYTISTSQNRPGASSLYVSADGMHVQDVTVSTLLPCTPTYSNGVTDHIQFASIPIAADGSFTSGTVTETGVIGNSPATFSYTLSGQFTGSQATGSLREDITFNNGTAYSCTTNPQTWSATRDTQGAQTASPPQPGSYTVTTLQNRPGTSTMYVSADGTKLQDVTVPTLLECTPVYSNGIGDHIQFASIPIAADGSFTSGPVTETGVIDNQTATFTYTLSGNFHGTTSAGVERIAGQLTEGITFNNGSQISCTTNPQTWWATRDTQGAQTASPPTPGSYTVTTLQNRPGTSSFTLSPDGTQLENVTVPTLLECTPVYSNGIADHIQFASIAITDGSFSATTTQAGTEGGFPAMFTYTFSGNFHGTSSSGAERAAGELREDITFNNGSKISCTTNPQTWFATGP